MFIGVVGKANTGKSTFFKACTLADVEIANYPFATINPNRGVTFVRVDCVDKEFSKQCNPRTGYCINGTRFVPVDIIDVAGLVPGAHQGAGMGNKFLDDLRQADVLVHVIDVSGSVNEKGEPVTPLSYDPANDIKFLEEELNHWYLGIFKKVWDKFSRAAQQTSMDADKAISKQFSGLRVTEEMVKDTLKKFSLDEMPIAKWTDNDLKNIVVDFRKKTKPIIIAANKIDVPGADKNFESLKNKFSDNLIVPCSAESELALKEAAKHGLIDYMPGENDFTIKKEDKLTDKQKNALNFIKKNVLQKHGSTGIQDVLDKAVFDLLGYIAVYPGGVNKLEDSDGNVLPDCFLLKGGSTALDFAFKLHTDFGNNFIKAINVKTKLPIAKDNPLKHRDVIEIMTNK